MLADPFKNMKKEYIFIDFRLNGMRTQIHGAWETKDIGKIIEFQLFCMNYIKDMVLKEKEIDYQI